MNIDSYYEQCGTGSPIVFIHGSYATTSTWKKIVEKLSPNHQCILVKLPGHSGTPDPDDFLNPSIETELNLLKMIVNRVSDQPIHLVGHSYGGVVALAQALKGNISLSEVSLFEPVAAWVLDQVKDSDMSDAVQLFLSKFRQDAENNVPYACGQVIDFWAGHNAFNALPDFIKDGMAPLLENNIRHWDLCTGESNNLSDLQQCTLPVRLIYGDKSNPVAQSICRHLHEHLPKSKKYVIQGASHFLVTSHADACLEALHDQFAALN